MLPTASVVVVGFYISGRTVTAFKPQKYAAVVIFTGMPSEIDFSNDFELKCSGASCERMISMRLYAMAVSFRCIENNYTHSKIYSYVYKELALDAEKQTFGTALPGGICVNEGHFQKPMIYREYGMSVLSSPVLCRFAAIENPFKENDDMNDVREAKFVADECEPEVKHLYCFHTDVTACMGWGQVEKNGVIKDYIVLVRDSSEDQSAAEVVHVDSLDNEEQQKKAVSNVAFLSTVGFQSDVSRLADMAVSDILENKTLYFREEGGQEISEVNLNLATPALAVLVATTLLLAVLVLVSWICVVVLKV